MSELRTPWQEEYGLMLNTTSVSTESTFVTGGQGVGTNEYALPVIGYPSIATSRPIRSVRAADGLSEAYQYASGDMSFSQGVTLSRFTMEFEATCPLISAFLWLLLQGDGTATYGGLAAEAGTPTYDKTFKPYISSDCKVWGTVLRKLSGTVAESHRVSGVICDRLSLTGAEGKAWRLSVSLLGRKIDRDFDFDAQSSILNMNGSQVLLFQNTTFQLSSTFNVSSFTWTLTNGARPLYYSSNLLGSYVLGTLTSAIRFTVPRSDSNRDATYWEGALATIPGSSLIISNDPSDNTAFTTDIDIGLDSTVTVEDTGELAIQISSQMIRNSASGQTINISDAVDRI